MLDLWESGSMVLLVGAPGSGKSSWARKHFSPDTILSSDRFREMMSGDENNQGCSAEAHQVLKTIAEVRMRYGLTTVIDATNIASHSRAPYIQYAERHSRPTVAIIWEVPRHVCIERDSGRVRQVGEAVIDHFHTNLTRARADLFTEVDTFYSIDDKECITLLHKK